MQGEIEVPSPMKFLVSGFPGSHDASMGRTVDLPIHEWLIFMVNVGKYTSPMDAIWVRWNSKSKRKTTNTNGQLGDAFSKPKCEVQRGFMTTT